MTAQSKRKKHLDLSLVRGILFGGLILLVASAVLFMFSINTVTIVISTLIGLSFIAIALTGALTQLYHYERHNPNDDEHDALETVDFGSTVLSMLSHLIFWR